MVCIRIVCLLYAFESLYAILFLSLLCICNTCLDSTNLVMILCSEKESKKEIPLFGTFSRSGFFISHEMLAEFDVFLKNGH